MRPRIEALAALAASLLLTSCSASDPIGGGCTADLLPGDLAISEIFANPTGEDSGKEWFEIYNPGSAPVALVGVSLVTSKSDGTGEKKHRMSALTLGADDYLVVGTADPLMLPSYVQVGVGNDLGDLRNSSGRIAIFCGQTLVDQVTYDTVPDGASRSFGGTPNAVANDENDKWCTAKQDFGAGKGTPGEANETCPGGGNPTMCSAGGSLRALVAPAAGDLVISEWMPNPKAVDDTKGEWFELTVNRDVDLNGLQLGTAPPTARQTLSDPSCLRVTAGSRVLFANSKDLAMNGGLPTVDFELGFALTNSNATFFVGLAGVVLDQVSYAGSGDGIATQLDASKTSPADNEVAGNLCAATVVYGAGDKGTPRAANGTCGVIMPGDKCNDGGTARDQIAPQVGDLVITEWMANPKAVADASGEWFEVLVKRTVDLNGLQLGTDLSTLPTTLTGSDCIVATAGSYLVFANNDMMATNGGLPAVNQVFAFTLVNSNRGIVLARSNTLLDAVTYATTGDGISTALKPDKLTAADNDVADNFCPARAADTYGLGDRGTPGKVNACM